MYTVYPNRIRTDQGSIFASDRWSQITNFHAIELTLSGVNAHSSLEIGERLHSELRRIYNKITHAHPTTSKKDSPST